PSDFDEEKPDVPSEKDDSPPKKDDKKDDSPDKKDKDDDKKDDKKDEKDDAREALIIRAQAQEHGGISELQQAAKDDGQDVTAEEMGVEDTEGDEVATPSGDDMTALARSQKVGVTITNGNTLVVHHKDHGAVFHAVPSIAIRQDRSALRRLANRLYGLAVEDGFARAAAFANAKLLITAGVDDDIELDNVEEVPPKNEGITSDAEGDTRDDKTDDKDSVLSDNDVDTREKPPTVTAMTARRQNILRQARLMRERRTAKDILDDAEATVSDSEMKPSKPTMDSLDGAETNSQEQHSGTSGDTLSGGDDVIRSAQRNFSKLYEKRSAKRVAEAKEAFVRKLTQAVRIASTRMKLNHEEHPYKVAAVDVLASQAGDIEFGNGDVYSGMDVSAAVELTELIVAEGDDLYIKALLNKAADLMEKDPAYLADVESDLRNLAPVAVSTGVTASTGDSPRSRSSRVRREAASGNIENSNGVPATNPIHLTQEPDLRGAIGGSTRIGRRLNRIEGLPR
ncbi:MAG: hypothetical protein DRP01_02080, partial [Archaeoglobales archaeon]